MASQKKTQQKETNQEKPISVAKRVATQKNELIEVLEKIPIILIACKKIGISRATYYRWRQMDHRFDLSAYESIREGTKSVNELAQSKIIELISQGNLTACIFWLKCRDPQFVEKRHIFNEKAPNRKLSKETKDAIDGVFALFEKKAKEAADSHRYDGSKPS